MKKHKFLVHLIDNEYLLDRGDYNEDHPFYDKFYQTCEDEVRIITCHHEEFSDNVVTVISSRGDEDSLLRDCDGTLYFFADSWSKAELIEIFE